MHSWETHRFNLQHQMSPVWAERADAAVSLIEDLPGLSELRVADVGCGDCKLRSRLQRLSRPWTYAGYDLLPQFDAVTRFDLVTDHLPAGAHDVAVLLGVVSYVKDPPSALARLAERAPFIVFSDQFPVSPEPVPGWVARRTLEEVAGWIEALRFRIVGEASGAEGQTRLWACATDA